MNYNDIQKKAYKLLFDFTNEIPIDPFKILSYFENIEVCTYKQYSNWYNISEDDVAKKFNSDEGFLLRYVDNSKNKSMYLMGYNQNKSEERIRFTIAHELGHFILRHNEKTDKNILNRYSLSGKETEYFEKEANHFAKHLLVPFPIALYFKKHLKIFNHDTLSTIFNINFEPSNYIISNLNKLGMYAKKYFNNDIEKKIIFIYGKSIEKILYKKRCTLCGNIFYGKYSMYCPVCGDKENVIHDKIDELFPFFIDYGKDTNMKYTKIALNENHKAFKCPVCENENILDGDFCQICGKHIVNKCTNPTCNEFLDGDARYCSKCGTESTFFVDHILIAHDGSFYIDENIIPF